MMKFDIKFELFKILISVWFLFGWCIWIILFNFFLLDNEFFKLLGSFLFYINLEVVKDFFVEIKIYLKLCDVMVLIFIVWIICLFEV